VIYGDFACPFSYLASVRSQRLVDSGRAEIEWRAVAASATPPSARNVEGDLGSTIELQVEEIQRLTYPDDRIVIRTPRSLPDTTPAVLAVASAEPADAARLRQALFHALWRDGRDISKPAELHRLGARLDQTAQERVDHWRRMWRGLDSPAVPMVILRTGGVLRRVDALQRLWSIEDGTADARRREFFERRMARRPPGPTV
jgi:hypothetical protein